MLNDAIEKQLGVRLNGTGNSSDSGAGIVFKIVGNAACGKEGYKLNILPTRIEISANTQAGLFYGIQSLIQLLPWNGKTNKTNTFHWHLTDDPGWRIEIKQFPLLTSVGALRRETLIGYLTTNRMQRSCTGAVNLKPHWRMPLKETIR